MCLGSLFIHPWCPRFFALRSGLCGEFCFECTGLRVMCAVRRQACLCLASSLGHDVVRMALSYLFRKTKTLLVHPPSPRSPEQAQIRTKVHVYVCEYVCVYVRTYVCLHVCIYGCMCVCIYVLVGVYSSDVPGGFDRVCVRRMGAT